MGAIVVHDREERRADLAVLLCLQDTFDRLLVLKEDDVGVSTLAVPDQNPAQDPVLLLHERRVKVVRRR